MRFRLSAAGAALGLALASLLASAQAPAGGDLVARSTREMARVLQERAAAVDPTKLQFVVNSARADALAARLRPSLPLAEAIPLRFDLAAELVNAGRFEEGLQVIDALAADAQKLNPEGWRRSGPLLLTLKAVAHLRMGEEQNCHAGNNPESCLLPIQGAGIHRQKDGSTHAIEALEDALRLSPGYLRARWLLNIAHMTLGTYPQGVPEAQLIPPAVFTAEYALPRFPNVSRAAGLDIYALSGGAILDDFDGDGRLDLMVSSIGFTDPLRFFKNLGDGRFEERTSTTGLEGETGGLNLLQADYDNDGRLDALVLRGGWMGSEGRFPVSLLHNDGGGRFSDATVAAGLDHRAPTQTAVFLDYDGDGFLDLFIGNESTPGAVSPCELYRNNHDGTFTEMAAKVGLDVVGFVKGVTSADYNNDGRPDLYLSLGGQENYLFRNDGPAEGGGWRFTNVAREAGVTQPLTSFPAVFFDYDNDGWTDLFVGGYGAMAEDVAADYLGLPTAAERGRLYRNRGDGTFADVTREAGLYRVMTAMGMNVGDLDNDGFLDLYVGTGNPDLSTLVPNRMFRNSEGRVFQDVTTAGGFGHLQKGHAICFGDVDDDGDQDVFEEMGGAFATDKAYSALYRNPGNANGFVALELVGTRSNRSAIGARLKLVLETDQGPRPIYRTVGSGGSFGASPLRLDVGTGLSRRVLSAEAFWPASGITQTIAGLKVGRRYQVIEGRAGVLEIRAAELAGKETMMILAHLGLVLALAAPRITLDVQKTEPLDAVSYGTVGAYEKLTGTIRGEIDPVDPRNAIIVDLDLAPPNASGLVEYVADFVLIKPRDMSKANGVLRYDAPNRGNMLTMPPDATVLERGEVILHAAWQGDVPKSGPNRLTLTVPVAKNRDGSAITGLYRTELVTATPVSEIALPGGTFNRTMLPYAPASLDNSGPECALTRRRNETDPRLVVPRADWAFASTSSSNPFPGTPDAGKVSLKGGFDPRFLYELTYVAKDPKVTGTGLAALRDTLSFFRTAVRDAGGHANPLAGRIHHVIGVGISQSGNFLRTFLHLGFNQAPDGGRVFDGVFSQVSPRLTSVNVRFGAPGGGSGLRSDHTWFGSAPRAFAADYDNALTGQTGGILKRSVATGTDPKIFLGLSSTEYWVLQGSPVLHDPLGLRDLDQPKEVRIYHYASTQHGGPSGARWDPARSLYPTGVMNQHDDSFRALFLALEDWVVRGKEPPPSRIPRIADGTLVRPDQVVFPSMKGVSFPVDGQPREVPDFESRGWYDDWSVFDFGPRFVAQDESGIPDYLPPRNRGRAYTMLVPQVDADGLEIAGIRSVEVQAALGTSLGFNYPADPGLKDFVGLAGAYIPFHRTKAERLAAGDTRLSLEERYGTQEGYVAAVKKAATALVAERFLLERDAARLIEAARRNPVLP